MPITVSCICGRSIRAKDELAGKRVKCPGCGQALDLPAARSAAPGPAATAPRPAAADPFGLGGLDLSQADPFGMAPGGPLMPGSGSPLMPGGSMGGSPLRLGMPQKKRSSNAMLWIGLGIGGGVAALAGLIVVLIVVLSRPSPTPLAGGGPGPGPVPGPPGGGGGSSVVVDPDDMPPVTMPGSGGGSPAAPAGTSQGNSRPGGDVPAGSGPPPAGGTGSGPMGGMPAGSGPPGAGSGGFGSPPGSGTGDDNRYRPPGAPPGQGGGQSGPPAGQGAEGSGGNSGGTPSAPAAPKPAGPSALSTAALERLNKPDLIRGVELPKDKPESPPLAGYGWMVHLLPSVGFEDVYKKYDFTKDWDDPVNLQLSGTLVPAFLNPADKRERWKDYPFALTHFVGMSGIEDMRQVVAGKLPRTDPRAGIFGYDEVIKPSAIADGASTTIMLIGSGELASPWIMGGGATIRGARDPIFDELSGFGSLGLPHRGALVVMADGSVKFIKAEVNSGVFKAMCTVHGAETVDLGTVPELIEAPQ